MSNPFRIHPNHPLRAPDWRWLRAETRIATPRASGRSFDDEHVARLVRLKKAMRAGKDEYERAAVLDRAGDLGVAISLWDPDVCGSTGEDGAPRIRLQKGNDLGRAELEARLLTGQNKAEIAQRLATTKGVIECYSRTFFDIDDRLENPGYIAFQVIGPDLHCGQMANTLPVVWKSIAYASRSPALLDQLTSCTKSRYLSDPNDLSQWIQEDLGVQLARKAALAARTMPVNEKTASRLIELHAQLLEATKDDRQDGQGLFEGSLAAVFRQVAWMVGGANPQLIAGTSGELRARELLSRAVPTLPEAAPPDTPSHDDFVYPPPNKQPEPLPGQAGQ